MVAENDDVAVSVETQLYTRGFREMIHVRVLNKTKRRLALDLRRADQIVYPNLWQLHRASERPFIIEARAESNSMDAAQVERLKRDFKSGGLTPLVEFVEYYCGFNIRNLSNADYSGNERYVTISMDGQLVYCDGDSVGILDLHWRNRMGPRQTDVVMTLPLKHSKTPDDALLLDAPPNPAESIRRH